MKSESQRVVPTGQQARIAQLLTDRAEEARLAYDEAILLRNQFFYKIGTLEDPPVSPAFLSRVITGVNSANYMLRLLQGAGLKNDEQRNGAKELDYDDPRFQ